MKKLILIICVSILTQLAMIAQDGAAEDYKIIPPSPTAYELGKYGQIPVGYFTGTPNVSVPLYNYKAGKLSLPVSLSYNSNGIQVDQLSSNVGLGWSLNAGGVITRIIKDEPDEESNRLFPEKDIRENVFSPMALEFFGKGSMDGADTEADLFMFNFNGYSGKFVYDNDKNIVLLPYQTIKIVPFYNNDNDNGYTIITPDGVKFVFSETERTQHYSQQPGRQGEIPQITAWYLSKIIHPDGDQINLIYETDSYSYTTSISQSHLKSTTSNYCSGGAECEDYNDIITNINKSNITQWKKLTEIHSNNPIHGKISFSWGKTHPDVGSYSLINNIMIRNDSDDIIKSYSFVYLETNKNRIFLEKISFKDPAKQYSFEYIEPEKLCERNSYSQDYWGYFNDANNNYFVPKITDHMAFINSSKWGNREPDHEAAKKGLLTRVIYPTGGYNNLEYEANTYFGEQTIYPPPAEFEFETTSPPTSKIFWDTSAFTNIIAFNQDVIIDSRSGFYPVDPTCEYELGKHKTTIKVVDEEYSPQVLYKRNGDEWIQVDPYDPTSYIINEEEQIDLKVKFEKRKSYAIIVHMTWWCTRASADFTYYDEDIQVVETNIGTGGSRIKRISAFDPVSGKENETYYYYNEIGKTDISSGKAGSKGYYVSNRINRMNCGDGSYIDCEYFALNSNSLIPLINTGNNNIYYEYVTVSHGGSQFEQGAEAHHFIVNRDEAGTDPLQKTYIPVWSNTGWNNGLKKWTKIYKNSNGELQLVKRSTTNYKNDERIRDTVHSYNISKLFEWHQYRKLTYKCTSEDVNRLYQYSQCSANHTHWWWSNRCMAPGNNMKLITKPHPCKGKPVGFDIKPLDHTENLSIVEYKNYSYWHYDDVTTMVEYFGGDSTSNISNSFYDNPEHAKLTRVETTNSKNEAIKTITTYADDITSPSEVFIDQEVIDSLKARYMIAMPLKSEKFVKDQRVDGQITSFEFFNDKTNILPERTWVLEGDTYEIRNNFEYDTHGNPVQYNKEDDIFTAYLWGYNYSYPIAKIENAKFNIVENLLTVSYAGLQTKSSAELKNLMTLLRNEPALQNAMVYSYTYDPLVGMTSETGPDGKTTTYKYDDFKRLETIRDDTGNVIKHVDYQYYEAQ